ncbi:energy-coupling factor ABC transporter ATP-binding protein [Paenibacillus lautus]|uniref:ABC transporter ATP-binding protein n=1 Tax=Paenibacillus lautus TaxID=1401 RepID=A0A385TWU5_PAELA|nr:ABC transporter ATP-binding protein [Paenibacillus lautus]AYB47374.1 ABC transporter ATP-binding protein [Paenibacillus lautus]MBY0163567.1 ABC transporter ATP-binding protein [Cytobacillus firmus]VTR31691.1 DL-methionine transporter ATP-binding subunit [Actinobacillus pleuropneumoniae]
MSIITIKNLSYQYPISESDALKNVNVTIERGKLYALIGANGGGKTTLCNVIRGFIPHFYKGDLRGEVLIEGKDIREWEMGELSQKIGYVFQNPFTQISGVKDNVFEEIAFGLENLGMEPARIREKVDQVINMLEIGYLRDKNPFELSGGQKQRVALASIIVMEPDVLVIDEPTSQLDPKGTEEVFKIIELMKKKGKTIILVEHKIELIAEYADDVILLSEGEVAMQGSSQKILTDERALAFGAALPQYSLFGLDMRKRGMDLGSIPLTEKEALEAVQTWMKKGVNA